MAHDDDVVDVQFVDGNHEAADDAVKVFKSRIAGDLMSLASPRAMPMAGSRKFKRRVSIQVRTARLRSDTC